MARSRTPRETVALAENASRPAQAESVAITASDIAHRAFDSYYARGRQDSHDVDDWLQAERELQGERPPVAQL